MNVSILRVSPAPRGALASAPTDSLLRASLANGPRTGPVQHAFADAPSTTSALLPGSNAPSLANLSRQERQCLIRLAERVTEELGIRMPDVKHTLLLGRLVRRLRAAGLSSLAEYEHYLNQNTADEIRHFYDVVTTNKTEFFRESRHFEYLVERALPALSALQGNDARWTCRVWCAGCSSGQEAYTLAMVLSEYAQQHPGFTFDLTATDISSRVLEQATAGIYSEADVEPVPMALRKAYLLRSKDQSKPTVRVRPELRRKVRFGRLNFMDAHYSLPGPFDLIFFRNVMIYFDQPTQEQVIQRQARLLRDRGYFFISHTETLSGLQVPLHSVSNAVYQKKS